MADDTKGDDEEADGEEKGKKKRLILGIVGGLVVAGAGGFGVTMLLGGGEAAEEAEVAEVVEEAEPAIKYGYVDVPRMPAPIMDSRGRVAGYYMIDLTIELENESHIARVFNLMPRIQNAFTKTISTHGISVPDDPATIDFEGLKKRLTLAANEAIGEDLVNDVMIARVQRTS